MSNRSPYSNGKSIQRRARTVLSLGAGLAAGALVMAACNAVLGIGQFEYGNCPEAGVFQCDASQTLICDSTGHWVAEEPATVAKIDLLLVVDDSPNMADKQAILAEGLPELIGGLVNPPCIDPTTRQPVAVQPAGSLDACPAGSSRAFPPNLDLHAGVITSSLGTFGADGCPDKPPVTCPTASSTPADDHGHLVTRVDACGGGVVPTYQGQGFLAWDPAQKLKPTGETDVGKLASAAQQLVVGAGELGCGFESQNEAWYRFLVDPAPYGSISLVDGQVVTKGQDQALLAQRSEFLRPNSLLLIVVLTDETDVSIKQSADYPRFADADVHLPHARQECASKGPTDPCCASCGESTPEGCPKDAMCASSPSYTAADENTALRAFGLIGHKQRYGIEFFYPPSRYVQALTSATVPDAMGNLQTNPIFAGQKDSCGRDGRLVYYAAITGVPWQLVSRQKDGVPDLINGASALDPTQTGGFKTFKELSLNDSQGNTFWDDIAGDPESYVPAKSPFMQESTVPRSGTDPITGVAISPPSAANGTNPLNGHEWTTSPPPMPAGDIEYACVFDLPKPRDCSTGVSSCDCNAATADNPICEPNPADGNKRTLQTRAKAYPGLKHLAIAKGLGEQGIVASICPKQLTDATQPDYGYRPALQTILRTVQAVLLPVRDGGLGNDGGP